MTKKNRIRPFRKEKRVLTKPTENKSDEPHIELKHIRFDGFDVYTVKLPNSREKLLFHREAEKTFVIGDTFKYLGSKDNLWLCQDIHTDKIHIAPFNRFSELDKKGDGSEIIPYVEIGDEKQETEAS